LPLWRRDKHDARLCSGAARQRHLRLDPGRLKLFDQHPHVGTKLLRLREELRPVLVSGLDEPLDLGDKVLDLVLLRGHLVVRQPLARQQVQGE
jgi:hypothetical protein